MLGAGNKARSGIMRAGTGAGNCVYPATRLTDPNVWGGKGGKGEVATRGKQGVGEREPRRGNQGGRGVSWHVNAFLSYVYLLKTHQWLVCSHPRWLEYNRAKIYYLLLKCMYCSMLKCMENCSNGMSIDEISGVLLK